MKKTKLIYIAVATALLVGSCKQEPIITKPAEVTPPTTPSKGNADFTKFVAIGNSLTAGFQAGALFNEGQANSLPKIMANQFATVGGGAFNQPDINSVNGFNSSSSNVGSGIIRGRLILFDPDGPTGPKGAGPAAAGTPGIPAPFNTADLPTPFTGNKANLNNFGVPGILLGQGLTPLTGGPSTGNPAYNGLYARFASNPGTSTIIGDAIAAQPTFFFFDLGNNDVLGYATTGGSGAVPITSTATFQAQYTAAMTALLANTAVKGVVGNIPDVTTIPFFRTVLWNAIPMDAATAAAVNGGFAGYNGVLDAIKGNAGLLALLGTTGAALDARKVSFSAVSNNEIVIIDKTLPNLGPALDALLGAGAITSTQRAQLTPYQQAREANSGDLITLSAGGILGTTVGGNPLLVNGVSVPLADQFVLLPSETTACREAVTAFNAIIKAAADNSNNRVALADFNAAFTDLVNTRRGVYDGITITPNFAPPTGAFSEDGVHPNSRGYAFMARICIQAINAKFNAAVPLADISKYKGTGLPINP
jgi:lysophospholipase L1-like esterase